MISLGNLNRQHNAIKEEVTILENEINKGKAAMNVSEIAFHICKLTGLLKVHLLEEDRFLYPNLLQCENNDIRSLTNQYILEMGNLVDVYTIFKANYSLERRINNNIDAFLKDAVEVVKALKARIRREETELFDLIQINNL